MGSGEDPRDLENGWSIPWSGERRWVPFYPDGNSTYWYYAFRREVGDTMGIRILGEFAHARYQSFNVYNEEGDFVNGDEEDSLPSSLRDDDVLPDPGSDNPFWLAVDRAVPERDYTVEVVPDETQETEADNVITFPDDLEYVSIFLRVYLPDDLNGPHGLSGGVPLPELQAFDTETGEDLPLPERQLLALHTGGNSLDHPPAVSGAGPVYFYNIAASGLYANQDNAYLTSLLKPADDSVVLLRLKPPTYTNTAQPAGIIPAETMVRYWSFNLCDSKLTNTLATLADYEAKVAADGFVYIVLSDGREEIASLGSDLNHLSWGRHRNLAVIYRNLVSNPYFPYSVAAVPVYDSQTEDTEPAQEYIGDYAPQGVMCSVEELSTDFDGFPIPG